eukprot:CAMPEP_0181461236 /NCGR_PEP_ID=MMETSP1110-20121109/33770_1 /TAXON_ID=174948 /ORGANISM="Symbiodinium sp., Strain CCMP421" /LENGTH=167 /DNA_ID=CAMNT_0023585847 /DNA_START=78 /DNA_END=585 /DNA_ORIENTATION=-
MISVLHLNQFKPSCLRHGSAICDWYCIIFRAMYDDDTARATFSKIPGHGSVHLSRGISWITPARTPNCCTVSWSYEDRWAFPQALAIASTATAPPQELPTSTPPVSLAFANSAAWHCKQPSSENCTLQASKFQGAVLNACAKQLRAIPFRFAKLKSDMCMSTQMTCS